MEALLPEHYEPIEFLLLGHEFIDKLGAAVVAGDSLELLRLLFNGFELLTDALDHAPYLRFVGARC